MKIGFKLLSIFCCLSILNSCKCEDYFYDTTKNNEANYFTAECHLVNGYPLSSMNLEVSLVFRNEDKVMINRTTLRVFPIWRETNDTLHFISEYASIHKFDYTPRKDELLDVIVQYDVDSLGIKMRRIKTFKGLKKHTKCRLNIGFN